MKYKINLLYLISAILVSGCFFNSRQEVHVDIPSKWNGDIKTKQLEPTKEIALSWTYSDANTPAQFLLIETSWGRCVKELKSSQTKIVVKQSMFNDPELTPHPTPSFIDLWFFSNETLAENYSVPSKDVHLRTRFQLQNN